MKDLARFLDPKLRYALTRTKRLEGRPWMVDPSIAQALVALNMAKVIANHPHHLELELTKLGQEAIDALPPG